MIENKGGKQINLQNQDVERLLRLKQFIPGILPISRSQFLAGVRSGRYPQPVRLGPRTTCWKLSEIQKLIESGA